MPVLFISLRENALLFVFFQKMIKIVPFATWTANSNPSMILPSLYYSHLSRKNGNMHQGWALSQSLWLICSSIDLITLIRLIIMFVHMEVHWSNSKITWFRQMHDNAVAKMLEKRARCLRKEVVLQEQTVQNLRKEYESLPVMVWVDVSFIRIAAF